MGARIARPLVPCHRVVVLGLDSSGKTTILYRLKQQRFTQNRATICFNSEKIYESGKYFHLWDVGGHEKIRSLWPHYSRQSDLLVFVVDSRDQERLPEARLELERVARSLGGRTPVLVLANKQDLPGAASVSSVSSVLGLHEAKNRLWSIRGCCAVTGEGLETLLADMNKIIRTTRMKNKNKL